MKKLNSLIVLSIVAVLAIFLIGCSGNSNAVASSSVNLDEAVELDWEKVYWEYEENEARASQNWDGKTVKWSSVVEKIEKDYVTCRGFYFKNNYTAPIDVYLSAEDLVKLNKGDAIIVVGEFSNSNHFHKIYNAKLVD